MKKDIERIFRESIRVKEETLKNNSEKIVQSVESIRKLFTRNGKILFFGNGGTASISRRSSSAGSGKSDGLYRRSP